MVLKNCTLIVGDGTLRKNVEIEIEKDRITRISEGTGSKDGIDLGGRTVMPGFIDTHVHLMLSGENETYEAMKHSDTMLTMIAYRNAFNALCAGFTTVCDKGARGGITYAVKRAIEEGLVPGPRLVVCGRMICMTGGHGHWLGGREADGVDECRKAAREQLKDGADFLKIMATGGVLTKGSDPNAYQLEVEEMRVMVHEAQKVGKTTSAHAINAKGVANAARAGIHMIEHASRADEEAIKAMAEGGSVLVATLSSVLQEVAHGPDWVKEKAGPNLRGKKNIIAWSKKYGVRVLLGTDAGTPHNLHGNNAGEFKYLVEFGLDPMEAIRAGTGYAAEALGLSRDLGTVEEGKIADLVVLDGNPLEDISAVIEKVLVVIKGGEVVVRSKVGVPLFSEGPEENRFPVLSTSWFRRG